VLVSISVAVGAVVFLILRHTNRTLQTAAAGLSQTSELVASAAVRISSSSQALAQGVSERAASVTETSAVADANRTLQMTQRSMRDINISSDKIGEIIKVIYSGAQRCRRSRTGRGCRNGLRGRRGRSPKPGPEIGPGRQGQCQGSTKLDQLASAIRHITERADRVKALIKEVPAGSEVQTRDVEQIARAMTQMEQVTQSSAASAEEAASAGESMSAQTINMLHVVDELEEMVGGRRRGGFPIEPAARKAGKNGRAADAYLAIALIRLLQVRTIEARQRVPV